MSIVAPTTFPPTLEVEVTYPDINDGKPRSACFCPLARAIMRAGGFAYVAVTSTATVLKRADHVGGIGNYDLGPDARRFLCTFDKGMPVSPFKFTATLVTK